MPKISVVIPTKNRKDHLIQNLRRLSECTFKDIEVIVVDDGSSDGTAEAIRELFPEVKLVRLEDSVGPSLACNSGMLAAAGEYFFITDDDCYVEPGAFEKMLRVFDEDPAAATVTFRITSTVAGMDYTSDLTTPYCKNFWSGATAIRAEVFRKVGGFSPFLRSKIVNNHEFDLAVRLTDHGLKMRYTPEIRAFEEPAESPDKPPVARLAAIAYWILMFFNVFPVGRAALFSSRAIAACAFASAKRGSFVPFLRGLWLAFTNLPGVLRTRHLVSPRTVAIYSDPDSLPDTYNVPLSRKVGRTLRHWYRAHLGKLPSVEVGSHD